MASVHTYLVFSFSVLIVYSSILSPSWAATLPEISRGSNPNYPFSTQDTNVSTKYDGQKLGMKKALPLESRLLSENKTQLSDAQLWEKAVNQILVKLSPFSEIALAKWNFKYAVFSPLSLYLMFGTLLNVAKEGSNSFQEVEELLALHRVDLPPFSLKYLKEFLISKEVISSRALYMKQGVPPKSKLDLILVESETTIIINKQTFDSFLLQSVPSFVLDYPPGLFESDAILLNAVSTKLGWFGHPRRESSAKPFYTKKGQAPIQTNFLNIQTSGKYFIGEFLSAISVSVTNENGKLLDGVSAYIIIAPDQHHQRNFTSAMLLSVNAQLSLMKEEAIDLSIPVFLSQNILTLNSAHFPHLLRNSNPDLEILQSQPLKQVNIIKAVSLCVKDMKVSNGLPVRTSVQNQENSHAKGPIKTLIVNSPFQFVLVEQKTGGPILIANVNNVVSGNNKPC